MDTGAREQGTDSLVPGEYRPHLDGIRTVAVYLVVLFHAGVPTFAGGFIGVDVFFVLSGYLVTMLLLRDLREQGSIRLGRFYSRRIRRLLPASVATLLVTASLYAAVAPPAAVSEAVDAIRAALLYYANWFFVAESTDYFADVSRSPVLHFWSLAVEEQFYVLWPLLLGGLWAACRRLDRGVSRLLPALVGLAAIASVGWALVLRADQPSLAYFGTGARAYQLLVGALLALLPGLTRVLAASPARRWLAPVGLVTVIGLGTSVLAVDPIVRGVLVAGAALLLLIGLEGQPTGAVARLLSVEPVVYLGRISYGTYLWHWPVIILAGEVGVAPSPWPLTGITFLVATGLAALSHQLLETPVRASEVLSRHRGPVIVIGLAASVVAALVVVPALTDTGSSEVVSAPAVVEGFTPVPASFDQGETYFDFTGKAVDCVGRSPNACTVVEGSGSHLLLMGDSTAQMMIPAFTEMARANDLRLSLAVTGGCPWQSGIYWRDPEVRAECRRKKVDAYERVIPALEPDVIVLMGARLPDMGPEYDGSEQSRSLRDATEASLAELARDHDVVIVKAMPRPSGDLDPLGCLADAEFVEECRFVVSGEDSWLDTLEKELADGSNRITVLDIDRLVCPFLPICDPMIGGIPVYWDEVHITREYSESLAEPLADQLRSLDLL